MFNIEKVVIIRENYYSITLTLIGHKSVDAIFNNPDSLACMINIREKDEYLLEHSVAVYITIFAPHLKMSKEVVQHLSVGAFLHDIGKIKIPDAVLNKPGKLSDEEFIIMKTHANHSIDIIKKTSGINKLSIEVAALHHEKLNGEGYPFQVKGKDIRQYGCMIAIVEQRNDNAPIKPKVRSFYSVNLNQYVETQDIYLTNTNDFIVKSVRAEEFNLDMNTIINMLLMGG